MARELLKHSRLDETATTLPSLRRQILDWEAGKHFPRDWATAYADSFGTSRQRLFSEESSPTTSGGDEADEMERRRLLQALAALGVSITPAAHALDQIRAGVDRTFGNDDLDTWEQTVAEYGYQYIRQPPAQLIADLATDVVTVQQIAKTQTESSRYPGWSRVASGLSVCLAKTLSNIGQTRLARDWWGTALRAAKTSGDRELALWIAGERTIRGLYEDRPLPILLKEADAALADAPAAVTRGRMSVLAGRAQVLAALGSPAAAQAMRDHLDAFEAWPANQHGDIASDLDYGEDRPRYVQAWMHAHAGNAEECSEAVAQAKRLYARVDARSHAQVELIEALGRVRAGDISEGIRHAATVYSAHPAEHRTVLVHRLATNVLDAVPPSRRELDAVNDYRALVSAGPGRSLM